MFVVSVEGPAFIDKGLWSTHKVLGAYATKEEAVASVAGRKDDDEVIILTNLDTGEVIRLNETNGPISGIADSIDSDV